MLHFFDFAREMNFWGVTTRLVLAVICGGMIGIEREYKRRPAGFRTHILICLGAAMTTLTSQYLYLSLHMFTDIARLGAQVIAGIGFIGAGTIIVTKRQRIKGLTTAAGLWVAAIIGLVCGAGYVECALFATAMVLFSEVLLIKIEYRYGKAARDVNLYVEYSDAGCIESIIRTLKELHVRLTDMEITRIADEDDKFHYCAMLSIRAEKKKLGNDLINALSAIPKVTNLEEL